MGQGPPALENLSCSLAAWDEPSRVGPALAQLIRCKEAAAHHAPLSPQGLHRLISTPVGWDPAQGKIRLDWVVMQRWGWEEHGGGPAKPQGRRRPPGCGRKTKGADGLVVHLLLQLAGLRAPGRWQSTSGVSVRVFPGAIRRESVSEQSSRPPVWVGIL